MLNPDQSKSNKRLLALGGLALATVAFVFTRGKVEQDVGVEKGVDSLTSLRAPSVNSYNVQSVSLEKEKVLLERESLPIEEAPVDINISSSSEDLASEDEGLSEEDGFTVDEKEQKIIDKIIEEVTMDEEYVSAWNTVEQNIKEGKYELLNSGLYMEQYQNIYAETRSIDVVQGVDGQEYVVINVGNGPIVDQYILPEGDPDVKKIVEREVMMQSLYGAKWTDIPPAMIKLAYGFNPLDLEEDG